MWVKKRFSINIPISPNNLTWVIFYFLSRDPIFTHYPELAKEGSRHVVESARHLTLSGLNLISIRYEKRRQEVEHYRELWAKERWFVNRLLPFIPPDVLGSVLIELETKESHPYPGFFEAAFGAAPEPVAEIKPSILDRADR